MHSFVIQLEDNEDAVADHRLRMGTLEDEFVGELADYVSPFNEGDTRKAIGCLEVDITVDEPGRPIGVRVDKEAREKLLRVIYDDTIRTAKAIAETPYEDADKLAELVWTLNYQYDDRHSVYVYSCGWGLETYMHWLRHADLDKEYWVGSAYDYHF